jgi:hypothetical protein
MSSCERARVSYLSDFLVFTFLRLVFPNHLFLFKININPSIAKSNQDIVQPHEESRQEEKPLWHDADFAGKHGNSIIGQLVLIENDLIEE